MVNSDVMGPGFQSAYGLVLAIHIDPKRGGFDNQIRTHGSVDYTSIARRFSHGCHRLVNNRAVRMFDFVLRHHTFRRIGDVPLRVRRKFTVDNKEYAYKLDTRGYYYELAAPGAGRRQRGARHGRGEEADPQLHAQARRRLQRASQRRRQRRRSPRSARAPNRLARSPPKTRPETEPPGAGDNAHELGP